MPLNEQRLLPAFRFARAALGALALALHCSPGAFAEPPSERTRALGFAAIALAKPVATRVDGQAAENRLWGDPEACARLLGRTLEGHEQRLEADPGAMPGGLVAAVRRITASPLVADERIARAVPSACSRRGLEEYGNWCNDLLNGLGLTDAHKNDLRSFAVRELLEAGAQQAAARCPAVAARSIELLAGGAR